MKSPIMKKTSICLVLIAILYVIILSVIPASSVSAPAGISLQSSVQATFPTSIAFKIKAQSEDDIVQLRLHYKVDRQNYADVTSEGWAQFTPANSVETQWVWDMRKGGLPVGAQVEYWWSAKDAGGKIAETSRSVIFFNDNTHNWQSITEDPVTLLWYKGTKSFAQQLMAAAQGGLQMIEEDTGAQPKGEVRIYIYANGEDLRNSVLFAQQWMGGATFFKYNVIIIGVSPEELDFGLRAIPHELTHWIIGQMTFNNYGAPLPTWLDEGLATYSEGVLASYIQAPLINAIKNNTLISVRALSSPFSAIPERAYTSYGESVMIVSLLIHEYGREKMLELLNVFQQGSGYDEALEQVYGFDQDGLDKIWRDSISIKIPPPKQATERPVPIV